jgi:hypothetical protein
VIDDRNLEENQEKFKMEILSLMVERENKNQDNKHKKIASLQKIPKK